jgi:hypothetical protein
MDVLNPLSKKVIFRMLWIISLVAALGAACKLANDPIGVILGSNTKILETVTQVGGVITQAGGMITEIGPAIDTMMPQIGTMMPDMETQIGGITTLIPGDLLGGTEVTPGPVPTDIPIMPGGTISESSPTKVSYDTDSDVKAVADYYDREMPKIGWTKVTAESKISTEEATLVYTKGGRKATVSISSFLGFGTTVEITIQGS